MHIYFDQLNRKIELQSVPKRIVSLVPSQTELLVDLGLEEILVGITKFCVHPRYLRKKKKIVGGTKQVHLDKIANLTPDLILCNKEENTEEMVNELEQIAPVHVSDVRTVNDSLDLILQYGEIFNASKAALEIREKILKEKSDFEDYVQQLPVKKTAYFIWKKPWMVAGKDTFIDHLLELNRFNNAFSGYNSRYPEVDLSDLEKEKVELVLLSTEPFPFKEEDKELFSEVAVKAHIHVVDGEFFSWYGSRLAATFRYFRQLQEDIRST